MDLFVYLCQKIILKKTNGFICLFVPKNNFKKSQWIYLSICAKKIIKKKANGFLCLFVKQKKKKKTNAMDFFFYL